MEIEEGKKTLKGTELRPVSELFALSGKRILEKILEQDNPQLFVRHIASEDFYWLIKKVGKDDCSPLLEMASDDQKQYLLDLELWQKDRLGMDDVSEWLGRLYLADPKALVEWLQSEGETLAYSYLFKNIRVTIRSHDEDQDVEEGFFTLDGVFYVKILDEEHRQTIENILRNMAIDNYDQYHAMLLNLAAVIPSVLEEEMYRLRNVRLAEHGFLPHEEALIAYTPLAADALAADALAADAPAATVSENSLQHEKVLDLIPTFPLYQVRGRNILSKAFSRMDENVLLDRVRIEFAGLCNQILSADGALVRETDVLARACRKAAGHMNLALERICGKDVSKAERLIKNNHLLSIFRVGFGLVLELKWETERWLKNSWFYGMGLDFSFWRDDWGEILRGLMEKYPRFYAGLKEKESFRSFEYISELDGCKRVVCRLKALDMILAQLTEAYPLDRGLIGDAQLTCHQILFTLWARQVLHLAPGFSGLSTDQVKAFFCHLRAGDKGPPYEMPGFGETFIKDFMAYAHDIGPELETGLHDALSMIWQEFTEEYEGVAADDMEGRFTRFLTAQNPEARSQESGVRGQDPE